MDPGPLRVQPRRHGRALSAALRVLEASGRALGGRALYRWRHLAPGRFGVREERVAVAGLPAELEGFTIAHLSDLHAGPWLGSGDLRPAVDAVLERAVDLVALTGDYVTHGAEDARLLGPDLARLAAGRPAFAVLGNHDYRGRREGEIAALFAECGVAVLRDACARVAVGRASLAVLGVEDLEEARVLDLERARSGARPGDVIVALCHNPRGAPALAAAGAVLVLAGHTHGCQVDLPLVRRLGPAHPGVRVELGGATLVVSRGLGAVAVPLRVGSPAEVVLVRLERERAAHRPAPTRTL